MPEAFRPVHGIFEGADGLLKPCHVMIAANRTTMMWPVEDGWSRVLIFSPNARSRYLNVGISTVGLRKPLTASRQHPAPPPLMDRDLP